MTDDPAMRRLLGDCLRIPSVSGGEGNFTSFIADHCRSLGLEVDLWQSTDADVARFPLTFPKHLPLDGRPTLVAKLRGTGGGQSIIFNAHADVVGVPSPEKWSSDPWGGHVVGDRFIGRGACDVKGPLVSALWAVQTLQDTPLAGDVMLELVPGEEDCVTLGTLTSVARGHTADACIVLEPTESLPRNASRGGCRFEVDCLGTSVHGTVKWLGQDAIELMRRVLAVLSTLETRWNEQATDPLFAGYPIARPLTVDRVRAGDWQGMVADHATISGYLELLPGDDIDDWQSKLLKELTAELDAGVHDSRQITVRFPERYPGHHTSQSSPLCQAAYTAVQKTAGLSDAGDRWTGWSGFNSGCEAGLRANLLQTPTLVWGPGSLAQAHAVDEFVEFAQVRAVAEQFVEFARLWCR